jgi:hypothetical protein
MVFIPGLVQASGLPLRPARIRLKTLVAELSPVPVPGIACRDFVRLPVTNGDEVVPFSSWTKLPHRKAA